MLGTHKTFFSRLFCWPVVQLALLQPGSSCLSPQRGFRPRMDILQPLPILDALPHPDAQRALEAASSPRPLAQWEKEKQKHDATATISSSMTMKSAWIAEFAMHEQTK